MSPRLTPIPPPPGEDDTPAESPLARAAREALRAPMAKFRLEFDKSMAELEARMCEALVEAVNHSHVQKRNEERLDRLEGHCFRTEPAPPPSGAE